MTFEIQIENCLFLKAKLVIFFPKSISIQSSAVHPAFISPPVIQFVPATPSAGASPDTFCPFLSSSPTLHRCFTNHGWSSSHLSSRQLEECSLLLIVFTCFLSWVYVWMLRHSASAAAKSLQSCLTLRPHRRQPTSSTVPGILQTRTLEWVAISFSNAWKWKVKVKSLSRVQLFATPNSSRPHGLQPIWVLHPRGFPGKSTGVGCHCRLQLRHSAMFNSLRPHEL